MERRGRGEEERLETDGEWWEMLLNRSEFMRENGVEAAQSCERWQ